MAKRESSGPGESGSPSGNPIPVVAAIVQTEEGILIARRAEGERRGGLWEFPGGKVEPGESPEEALVREIREELGIEVSAGELLHTHRHRYPDIEISLASYRCRLADRCNPAARMPRSVCHTEIRFVPPGRLLEFRFADADLPVARLLSRGD